MVVVACRMNQKTNKRKPKLTAYFSYTLLFTCVYNTDTIYYASEATLPLSRFRPIYAANCLIELFYPTVLY